MGLSVLFIVQDTIDSAVFRYFTKYYTQHSCHYENKSFLVFFTKNAFPLLFQPLLRLHAFEAWDHIFEEI